MSIQPPAKYRVSVFSSMAYERVANYQKAIGLYGNKINSFTYNPNSPVYNAMFSVKYVFYSTHLLVSCGIYGKERIEYSAIRQMKATKNPLSSAALSLDRLQIDYMQNGYHQTVLISPVHKKEFMEKLEQYRKEGMRKL